MIRLGRNKILLAALVSLTALVACKRVPSHVIQPEEMAQLMADIHIGEAVVDYNRNTYATDSMKMALKQSVYSRHGVTAEQVDTSFVWYGHNLDRYIAVYDRTIAILDRRLTDMGNRVSAEAALSIAGDSVDVWTNPRQLTFSQRMPSDAVVFSFSRDNNWQEGDSYTLRAKMLNNTMGARWSFLTEYNDGTVSFITSQASGEGWNEIVMQTDSTKQARRISGFIEVNSEPQRNVWVDSISLIRKRLNPRTYYHSHRQRTIKM